MCTLTTAMQSALSAVWQIGNKSANYLVESKYKNDAMKYQTQAAIANSKKAQNLMYSNIQEGINQSRIEKLKGIKEKNLKMANSAKSGFSINSTTNQYDYNDSLLLSNTNAKTIKNSYNSRALDYMNRANSYIDDANFDIDRYNTANNFSKFNYLTDVGSVAYGWYENVNSK